jgi:hypothetical protein
MKKAAKISSVLGLSLALMGCTAIERLAIPSSTLISADLEASGTQSQISHAVWDQFLGRYTELDPNGVVRVNYGAVTSDDKEQLDAYIAELASIDAASYTRDAQLAYWINLYNALTVSVILDHYPVESIRQIRNGLTDFGPWNEKRLVVNGRNLSLHDIENGIVRPLWNDEPRTHYALNCAALGCPNLAQSAYTADNIQPRLAEYAIAYINDPRGVTVSEDGKLTVSKIFSWYRGDYGGSDATILAHLREYADPELKAKLENATKINGYEYDWALNDTATATAP